MRGLAEWQLGWLKTTGAVCYERAAGRVQQERGGVADAGFTRGLVKTSVLPTAVANASDHYVMISPQGHGVRYMSVNEYTRAFGVPEAGPLGRMLTTTNVLTPNQVGECLGRSVHAGVARLLVRELLKRGELARGLRYGSAFSGIDTFAAGQWKPS